MPTRTRKLELLTRRERGSAVKRHDDDEDEDGDGPPDGRGGVDRTSDGSASPRMPRSPPRRPPSARGTNKKIGGKPLFGSGREMRPPTPLGLAARRAEILLMRASAAVHTPYQCCGTALRHGRPTYRGIAGKKGAAGKKIPGGKSDNAAHPPRSRAERSWLSLGGGAWRKGAENALGALPGAEVTGSCISSGGGFYCYSRTCLSHGWPICTLNSTLRRIKYFGPGLRRRYDASQSQDPVGRSTCMQWTARRSSARRTPCLPGPSSGFAKAKPRAPCGQDCTPTSSTDQAAPPFMF